MDDGINTHEAFNKLYNVPRTSELIVSVIKAVLYCTYISKASCADRTPLPTEDVAITLQPEAPQMFMFIIIAVH